MLQSSHSVTPQPGAAVHCSVNTCHWFYALCTHEQHQHLHFAAVQTVTSLSHRHILQGLSQLVNGS